MVLVHVLSEQRRTWTLGIDPHVSFLAATQIHHMVAVVWFHGAKLQSGVMVKPLPMHR